MALNIKQLNKLRGKSSCENKKSISTSEFIPTLSDIDISDIINENTKYDDFSYPIVTEEDIKIAIERKCLQHETNEQISASLSDEPNKS